MNTGEDANWNYAEAYMKRIDNLFQNGNACKIMKQYKGWFEALCAAHDEIASQMNDKELEESKRQRDLTNRLIRFENNVDQWVLRCKLSDWEIFLKRVLKDRGMDLPRKFDPSKAMFKR